MNSKSSGFEGSFTNVPGQKDLSEIEFIKGKGLTVNIDSCEIVLQEPDVVAVFKFTLYFVPSNPFISLIVSLVSTLSEPVIEYTPEAFNVVQEPPGLNISQVAGEVEAAVLYFSSNDEDTGVVVVPSHKETSIISCVIIGETQGIASSSKEDVP